MSGEEGAVKVKTRDSKQAQVRRCARALGEATSADSMLGRLEKLERGEVKLYRFKYAP